VNNEAADKQELLRFAPGSFNLRKELLKLPVALIFGGCMLRIIAALVLGMAIVPLQAAVVGKEVSYQAGDTVMKGYLA
jgi:large-conductance mechanosensitive channel